MFSAYLRLLTVGSIRNDENMESLLTITFILAHLYLNNFPFSTKTNILYLLQSLLNMYGASHNLEKYLFIIFTMIHTYVE